METIRQRREFFQKPIVMNLEYEIQMRNCFRKQRKSNEKFFVKKDEKEKNEENPCNINYPVCNQIKNFTNKNKPLIEFWGISQKFESLEDKKFIVEDYFFSKIKLKKRRNRKLNQSNKENIETTKTLLENINKSMELENINLSKSIDFSSSSLQIDENQNLRKINSSSNNLNINHSIENFNNKTQKIEESNFPSEENLFDNEKNLNENLEDLELMEKKEINEVKIKSSVNLDKINLTNLQIININLQKISEVNLITNFDRIENDEFEENNILDNLKIERVMHICECASEKKNLLINNENAFISPISNNNSAYANNGTSNIKNGLNLNLTEENKNYSDDVCIKNKNDGNSSISVENSFDEWGNKFSPGEGIQMKLLPKFDDVKKD